MTEAELFRRIKDETKVIAVVGLSPKSDRPSWGVARYLQGLGYRIIPVNPGHAGEQILGETVYPDLASIPAAAGVDMVDIFRRSDAVPAIVEDSTTGGRPGELSEAKAPSGRTVATVVGGIAAALVILVILLVILL